MTKTDITQDLVDRITTEGPLSIAAYMESVAKAYYNSGTVFGRGGDFITAPEISQVFGELVGLWCVTTWQALGRPNRINVVECGPGRGTLMADALRAIQGAEPHFLQSMDIHFVERSPALQKQQKIALPDFDVQWHRNLETLPNGPIIILGNEFLDALPIKQYEKTPQGWRERLVDWEGVQFRFVVADTPSPDIDCAFDDAPDGSILERSDAVEAMARQMALFCMAQSGAALMIDYGYSRMDTGDSLQAVRDHAYHEVLTEPGTADITAHVDFSLVAQAVRSEGADVFGPLEQGLWLRRLGATVREAQLCEGKPQDQVRAIRNSIRRLIEPDAMGSLFKAIAFASPGTGTLAGFEVEV